MMRLNIIFIGFMGSGKSSIGRHLAQELNMNFVDIDELIQKHVGMSVREIFTQKGESFFRVQEQNLSKKFGSQSNLVISTGGGIVLNQDTMKFLLKKGFAIYLECDFDTIVQRITAEDTRPLFNLEELPKFKQLFEFRKQFYEKYAKFTIDVGPKSINLVISEILQYLKKEN